MRRFIAVFVCLLVVGILLIPYSGEAARSIDNKENLVSPNIVIAGIFGGGGLGGAAPFTHDYIILFNRGETAVSLNGWSTQYASDSGTNFLVTPLSNTTLEPGQYYLIQYASNGNNGSPLPTPDVIAPVVPEGFIPNISSRDGKIALVNTTVKLPAETCPSSETIVDFVGFGVLANCFEGAPTPDLSATTATIRNDDGCTDSDNNASDFTIGAPAPLNTSSTINTCDLGGVLQSTGASNPATVNPGGSTLLTVTVTPATSPPSTGITVSGNLTNISGPANQTFFDDGTNGDTTADDNVFSFQASIPSSIGGGLKTVSVSVSDAEARTAPTSIGINVVIPPPSDNPLALGNPSNATSEVSNENNYLMTKPQYSLSYSRATATPNWVAWRLQSAWIGTAPRQDDYRPDPDLPAGWYRVQDNDYSGSGYSRGHVCPSGDRTRSVIDNSATFTMTNFFPQISENNGGAWLNLENELRTIAAQGKEIYIFAGGAGSLGTIANGEVTVPAVTWKVVMILENGENDLQRVGKSTRTIAIVVPNFLPLNQSAPWEDFEVNVDAVEKLTGLDFFSSVPKITQEIIERRHYYQ
jgi:endonuclease G